MPDVPISSAIRPFMKNDRRGGYYFYDLNAKIHHKINNKHHLYLSGYFGQDKALFPPNIGHLRGNYNDVEAEDWIELGNAIGAFRWNYFIGPKIMLNTTLTYSRYAFNIGGKYENHSS